MNKNYSLILPLTKTLLKFKTASLRTECFPFLLLMVEAND